MGKGFEVRSQREPPGTVRAPARHFTTRAETEDGFSQLDYRLEPRGDGTYLRYVHQTRRDPRRRGFRFAVLRQVLGVDGVAVGDPVQPAAPGLPPSVAHHMFGSGIDKAAHEQTRSTFLGSVFTTETVA